MINATLKSLWGRKRRLLGASAAVVIGVAFLVSTLVLGDSMRSGFNTFFTDAYAGTDVVVRNATKVGSDDYVQKGTIDESLLEQLGSMPGVARVAPGVEGAVQIIGSNGEPIGGDGPPTLGGNWIDESQLPPGESGFNGYRLVDGRGPRADDEVVIDRGAAKDGKLHVGDRTTVLTPDPVEVTVVGIATFGAEDSIGGSTYTGFTLAAAQRWMLGETGRLTNVQIAAVDGTTPEQLRAALQPRLPATAEALTQTELIEEQNELIGDDFLNFFDAFLLAFAIVALLVAAFSIHNTFSILVAQRTRESALLRALGASRRQVLSSVTIESFVLGALASAIGLAAGVGLAAGLKALMDAAGFGLPKSIGVDVSTSTIVIGLVVGVVVTLVASVAPAVKASRIAPLAALRDIAVDRSGASKKRAVAGVLVAAAGVGTVFSATSAGDGALARAGIGALVTLIGAVILGPVVAKLATGTLGAPVALLRGQAGSLARRNAMRNPRRSAGTASALMIGTAVVALFATFGASLKASLADIVDTSFTNDLVIAQDDFSGAPLSASLVDDVRALPEVDTIAALGNAPIVLDGSEQVVLAGDPHSLAAVADLEVTHGSIADLGPTNFAVDTKYAEDHGWTIGTAVPIDFADGTSVEVTLGAIFDNRNAIGDVFLPQSLWQPHQGRSGSAVILINLADGVSVADGKAAVQTVVSRFGAPDVQDRQEFVDANGEQVDQMLGLIYGLLGLAIIIAVLGIANTLSLSIHERTRELGLLRAVGQSRSQLRSTVRWESVIISIFGTLGGVGLGTFLGWGVMRALKVSEGFGTFALPVTSLVVILVLAMLAGVVAAVRPARRAARLDILSAIATA